MTTPEKPQTEQNLQDSDRLDQSSKSLDWAQDLVDYAAGIKAKAAIQPDKFAYAVSYAKEQIILIREDKENSTDNLSVCALEKIGMNGIQWAIGASSQYAKRYDGQ